LAREESVFCEAASAAAVAGLVKFGVPEGSRVVCILTGNGLKEPSLAIEHVAVPDSVPADARSVMTVLGL
jgi:threonine synthase